ncbi:MAG: type II toxin-antitoxin system VapC family toxin [Thermoproteota archaeon]
MKVVDTTLIAAFVMKEPGWERLVDTLVNAVTLDMAIKESMNVIWKAYRNKKIDFENAKAKARILIELAELSLRVIDEMDFIEKAFEIACSENLTIYDSLFLALAEDRNAILYTLDRKQAEKAERLKIRVKLIE